MKLVIMQKYADYIKQIEIDSLWSGKKHILWTLDPHVNVLSGINGVGKSTILNKVFRSVNTNGDIINHLLKGVHIIAEPENATHVRFDIIRSLDSPVLDLNTMTHVDSRITSALDFQLYHLQRKYLDYQVNIGNRIIEELQKGNADAAQQLSKQKSRFQVLVPYQLSSGEKQMLAIMLTVLVEDMQHYVLFMDEPEVSLHIEWQKRLIDLILELNPNVQIILTTHSPAVIMNGWMDSVTEVSDITL